MNSLERIATANLVHSARTGEKRPRAVCAGAALVAVLRVALLSLTLALSGQVFAQDSSEAPTVPQVQTLGGKEGEAQMSAFSRMPPELAARLRAMEPKDWGTLAPDFGDPLLGDMGGLRSTLAEHGLAYLLVVDVNFWQNLLNLPQKTNGSQVYLGQQFTSGEGIALQATYDLGHVGLDGAQFNLGISTGWTSFTAAHSQGFRVLEFSFYDSFLDKRIELSAGILGNDKEFVNTYVGGNTSTGAFGPQALLPVQSGFSQTPGSTPSINVTYNFDANWYNKIGVQRSVSPQGVLAEYSYLNPHGVRFSVPGAKALVIDEVGFKRPASADARATNFRMGGLYNWSDYTDFNTGRTTRNYNSYLLYDQQLSRPSEGLPFRGWYGGFTIMDSPSNVNVFRRYYETRFYDVGPFAHRPFDQLGLVATHSLFSEDARNHFIRQGVYPPRKASTSLTANYAYKAGPDFYVTSGLTYTDHPSFIYAPGQGHDLNFFTSIIMMF
jgi:porin